MSTMQTRVQKVVARYYGESMLRKSKKAVRKFEELTKLEKREWREELQRKIASIPRDIPRVLAKAFVSKPRGRNVWKIHRISNAERALMQLTFTGEVEYQAGIVGNVAAGLASAALCVTARVLTKKASRAADAYTDLGKDMQDLVKRLQKALDDFARSIRKYGVWLMKFVMACLGSWLIVKYAAAPIVVAVLRKVVSGYVPEAKLDGVTYQSGKGFVGLASLLCCLLVPGLKGDYARIANNLMRTISVFPKFSDGLGSFMDTSLDFVEKTVDFIFKRIGKQGFSFQRKKDLVTQWRDDVLNLCKECDSQATVPIELVHQLKDKVQEGYGLMALMAYRESKDEIARWVDKLNMRLAPHLGALAAENNMRPMPYMVMIGGGSGVGKTSVVQVFAAMTLVLSGEVAAEQVLQNLWQKGLSEYWNGYVGQKAIIKDDCFQVRGVAGAQDSEAMEIIRGVGNWACPLNYADLTSKGRYYLNAPLIVGTTNAKNIKADWEPFITCPEAIVRRFQGSYWLELNPAYRNDSGRYNFELINSMYTQRLKAFAERRKSEPEWVPSMDDVLDVFPWDAWVVRRHGFDHSNPESGDILPGGMKEAVKTAASIIRARKLEHAQTVENVTNHMQYAQDAFSGISFAEKQAGPKIIGEIRATTSHEFAKDKVPEGFEDCFVFNTKPIKGKITLDEEGEPVLLDLELAEASWIEKAGFTILAWISAVDKFCYGMVERIGLEHVSYKPVIVERPEGGGMTDLKEVHNMDAYILQYTLMAAIMSTVFTVVKHAIRGLWALVQGLFSMFGVKHQSNAPAQKEKGLNKYKFPRVSLQVGAPPVEHVYDNIYRNMYMLGVRGREGYVQIGNILCLGDQVFVMPAHFDEYVSKNLKGDVSALVELRHCTSDVVVSLNSRVYGECARADFDEGTDLIGLRMPAHVPLRSHRHILNYFLSEADISNVLRSTKLAVRLDVGREQNDGESVSRTILSSGRLEYVPKVTANDGSDLHGLVRYEMPTRSGDCGGVVTLSENRYYGGSCILGMHVAGKADIFTRHGYAVICSREAMREVWFCLAGETRSTDIVTPAMRDVVSDDMVQYEAQLKQCGIIGGSISYLGPSNESAPLASKSSLKQSPMHADAPFGECPVAPAVLTPVRKDGAVVYPMAKAVEAYQSPVLVDSPAKLELASDVAFTPFFRETDGMRSDILTFEEAIQPPPSMKLKALNRKSSAGFKYRKFVTPAQPGKTYFLGKEGDVDFSTPAIAELKKDVMHIVDEARQGNRTLHVCVDFLKDELRPLEKVDNVKTRMISATELDYTIAVRMYFGAFCAAMLATPVVNGMSPGVNHYTQWGLLAERLLAKGGKVFDGDFSRFDASEQPWVHEAIRLTIERWYKRNPAWTPEDELVRNVLWQDLIHSVHITGAHGSANQFVQWHKSLPSGHPLTTVVNSMYSLLTLTACYIQLTGDPVDMWKHVFINTFGDDNISGVDDEMCDKFNQVTVAQTMSDLFGLTYTAGAKDGTLVPYTTIDKVTFLKRSFAVDDEGDEAVIGGAPCLGWVGPLAKESFLYTPYYYRNNKDPLLDVENNCDILMGELSLHTQEMWDYYYPKLADWCSRNGVTLRFATRAAARAYIKTRFDVWF